jgi:outer membrane protein TolC
MIDWSFGSKLGVLTLVTAALGGCAAYKSVDLPASASPRPTLTALNHQDVPLDRALSIAEVARLAVENNPDLIATRAQRGVSRAQMLQASLLPNPQATGALLPLVAGVGTTTAWNAGLSQDVRALITYSATRRAAEASGQQVDAQILWQEWQTNNQARLLVVDIVQADRLIRLLHENRDLLRARYQKSQGAVAGGNATLASSAPDLSAVQAVATQLRDQERQQLSRRHQLNALLGLAPQVEVRLNPSLNLPHWDPRTVKDAASILPERRPDLVALQLGYEAQDAKLRGAILSQFPNLSIGLTGGSDNSNIRNLGPQVSLELPVFNQNQGAIAVESATRQQLHDEYVARLTTAVGQVRAMASEITLLSRQLEDVRRELGETRKIAGQAEAAFGAGNIDERSYVDLVGARLSKEQEIVTIEQSLLDQRIAIATLLGAEMPPITLSPPNPSQI